MVNYQKLYELEDKYNVQKRSLEQAADTLDDLHHQFLLKTRSYIDQVYNAFQGLEDITERNRALNQIEAITETYHRDYTRERDRIEDERIAIKRQFNNDYDNTYKLLRRQQMETDEQK